MVDLAPLLAIALLLIFLGCIAFLTSLGRALEMTSDDAGGYDNRRER